MAKGRVKKSMLRLANLANVRDFMSKSPRYR